MKIKFSNIIKDLFYSSFFKYGIILLNFIGSAVLARLLTPNDFGKVAIVLIIQNFFFLFGDLGIGVGLIQNRKLKIKDYAQIFTVTIFIGLVMSILFITSGFILFRHSMEDLNLVLILSINVLFFVLNIVPQNLLKKNKKFKEVGIYEFISFLLSWIICFLLIFYGFKFYSIVLRFVFFSIIYFLFCLLNLKQSIYFNLSLKGIYKIFHFSSFQFLFNFSNFFSRNTDQIIIKYFYTNQILGLYNRSYNLMVIPVGSISGIISSVFLSHSNHLSNNNNVFIDRYNKLLGKIVILSFSIGIILYTFGDEIIMFVYGKQWIEAIPIFKIMGILSGLQIIISFSGLGFQVLGNTKEMFKSSLVLTFLVLFFLTISLYFKDITYIVYAIILAYFFGGLYIFYVLYKNVFMTSFKQFIKILACPFISIIILLISIELLNLNLYNFILKLLIFSLLYSTLFLFPNKNTFKSIFNIFKK